jgi:cell division protease FtsH
MTEHAKSDPSTDRGRPAAPPPPPAWRNWLLVVGLVVSALILFWPRSAPSVTELSYTDFLSRVEAGGVATAVIDPGGAVSGTLENGGDYATQIPIALQDPGLAEELRANGVAITGEAEPGATVLSVIVSFLPFLLYIGRRTQRQLAGGIGGIIGSRAKVYDAEAPSTRFSDVAGYEGAKQEISEVVDFLKNPQRYAKAGAMGPRGVLMVGPPGTGKTLLARAIAGEAGVPFLAITGSGFVELFVGVGASRVRDLFTDAKKRAPAIVFIDEIDAIGQRRGAGFSTNDECEQTLNQLLAEMDGFDRSTGVVVLAATNRPEVLDPALLRPGRFDRHVEIPLPNQKERAAILRVHAKGKQLAADVDFEVVARSTPGFSGADLANLVNEAAIFAVRAGRETITAEDFSGARDRILLGRREASNALLPEEKRAVAVHETGHAIVAALSENADPVAKVTILPRAGPSGSPSSSRRTSGGSTRRATCSTR